MLTLIQCNKINVSPKQAREQPFDTGGVGVVRKMWEGGGRGISFKLRGDNIFHMKEWGITFLFRPHLSTFSLLLNITYVGYFKYSTSWSWVYIGWHWQEVGNWFFVRSHKGGGGSILVPSRSQSVVRFIFLTNGLKFWKFFTTVLCWNMLKFLSLLLQNWEYVLSFSRASKTQVFSFFHLGCKEWD